MLADQFLPTCCIVISIVTHQTAFVFKHFGRIAGKLVLVQLSESWGCGASRDALPKTSCHDCLQAVALSEVCFKRMWNLKAFLLSYFLSQRLQAIPFGRMMWELSLRRSKQELLLNSLPHFICLVCLRFLTWSSKTCLNFLFQRRHTYLVLFGECFALMWQRKACFFLNFFLHKQHTDFDCTLLVRYLTRECFWTFLPGASVRWRLYQAFKCKCLGIDLWFFSIKINEAKFT